MAEDREFPEIYNQTNSAVIGLGAPKDRIAAYILDCTLLLPLVQLFQSPFKKWIMEALLFEGGAGASGYRVFNLLIFIVLFVIYYTIMTWWKGQTIGKMFFNIKVISYHGHLSLFHSFLRSSFLFFEFLCLGIPFFAIFSHSLRRPIHDRVADTVVISLKNPASFPSLRERWQSKLALGLFSLFLGTGFLIYVFVGGPKSTSGDSLVADKKKCSQALSGSSGRLEEAIELQMLNRISDQCLYEQARDQLWKDETDPIAKFALAISLRGEMEKSDQYLQSVCDEASSDNLCVFSQWLQDFQKNPDHDRRLLQGLVESRPVPDFLKVMVASLLAEKRHYQTVDRVLKEISSPNRLEPLVASLTFHSLLGQLKWEEAFWVYRTHNQVNDNSLLYFMQLELADSRLSLEQQLQLLDLFYPSLGERGSNRSPASTAPIPEEIQDIYRHLEGQL